MSILIENLSKKYDNRIILNHINVEIQTGSLVAILGPSGSGKSTLLRTIAGFEKPDTGEIWLSGKNTTALSIQNRQIGFVFQSYALFPHLTVFQNLAFGMNIRSIPSDLIELRIYELLQLIQLEKVKNAYPHQLSGGQKQRVAFARALTTEPKVLLLDEPFGALDLKVRKELRLWLYRFHKEMPVTTLFVTHDQHEALEIANEVMIFQNGRIVQMAIPKEIIQHPANDFVRRFMLM